MWLPGGPRYSKQTVEFFNQELKVFLGVVACGILAIVFPSVGTFLIGIGFIFL
mgnify:CR=1 FL=1